MNLITLTYEVSKDLQKEMVEAIEVLQNSWREQGDTISLFRDATHSERFLQIILTPKSVDEVTQMIQSQSEAKFMFGKIKDNGGHVVVSFLEQIL